jgi:hypothetical protein
VRFKGLNEPNEQLGSAFHFRRVAADFLFGAVSGETVFAKNRGVQTLPYSCVVLLNVATSLYARIY